MKYSIQHLLVVFALWVPSALLSQSGTISGRVYNDITNEPLEYAAAQVQGTNFGAFSDSLGKFTINGIPPGLYNVKVTYGGYNTEII